MSSSYLESGHGRTALARAVAFVLLGSTPAGLAIAADTYVKPEVELRAENNDNFDLTPGGSADSDIYGYIADMRALMGFATPRSDTSIRPRLRFQEYPDRDDMERLEAFFDLKSDYRWERSRLLVLGRYSRQDTYNTETQGGSFDPLDPTDPGLSDAGRAVVGDTRNRFDIRPNLTFDVTERTKVGGEAMYQVVRFESDGTSTQIDYDYMTAEAFVSRSLDPRSDISLAAYVTKYEATDDSTDTDGYGGEIGYVYRWSEVIGFEASLLYEQNDQTDYVPVRVEDSTSGWGGTVIAYYKGEVSEWRASAGRTYTPTGSGGKSESDQFRVQYDRDLTQRLAFTGAGRFESRRSLAEGGSDNDRDYARADLSLEWMITPTWYVGGGYSYIWQDRESDDGDAYNNRVFLSFGYKGLGRQRR